MSDLIAHKFQTNLLTSYPVLQQFLEKWNEDINTISQRKTQLSLNAGTIFTEQIEQALNELQKKAKEVLEEDQRINQTSATHQAQYDSFQIMLQKLCEHEQKLLLMEENYQLVSAPRLPQSYKSPDWWWHIEFVESGRSGRSNISMVLIIFGAIFLTVGLLVQTPFMAIIGGIALGCVVAHIIATLIDYCLKEIDFKQQCERSEMAWPQQKEEAQAKVSQAKGDYQTQAQTFENSLNNDSLYMPSLFSKDNTNSKENESQALSCAQQG